MKSSLAVVAVALTVAIAGCENRAETSASNEPAAHSAAPSAAPTPAASASVPNFAVPYPGATIEGEPLVAEGQSGTGGVVTFTTEAAPDAVIAFYSERAEADGLAKTMSLNQGEARAYGAQKQASGASINVVAAPAGDQTSVQLTWSAGQ
jgi:hypothetical protein